MKFLFFPAAALLFLGLSGEDALAQGRPDVALPVVVFEAVEDDFVDRVEAIGTLRANETVTLAAQVTETVTAVNFEDGQRVSQGDILVEMTSGEQKALLDQQKSVVNEAQRQLQRARELAKNGAVSQAILDQRQREYTAARAGMQALQSRLEEHIIAAPFDGIVGLRNISAGALVQPGTTITTLDDDKVMKLDFSVPSLFLPSLHPGLEIVARSAGFAAPFHGAISAIDSQVNPNTRAVVVRAIIPNPDGVLKPGLLMSVELLKNPRRSVVIPETAIVPEGRRFYIFVVDEAASPTTVKRREIQIGARRPGDVEVISGVRPGEKVVVRGTMMVRDGSPVIVSAIEEKGDSLQDLLEKSKSGPALRPAAQNPVTQDEGQAGRQQ